MNEDNLQQALLLLENGKSVTEVLGMFPNDPELGAELMVIESITKEAKLILPAPDFKNKLWTSINKNSVPRFNLAEFLQHRLKIFLPILIATAVLVLVFIKKDFQTQLPDQNQALPQKTTFVAPMAPSGDIQTTVDGIISDYTSDSQITSQGDSDISEIQKTYSTFNSIDINNENSY